MLARPDPFAPDLPWRRLDLSQKHGIWCLVSARHWDWIAARRWNYGWWANTPHKHYAKRNVGAARSTVYLHREIMQRIDPRPAAFAACHLVDHINGQPLDNRDENLRWSTVLENNLNRIAWDDVPSLEEIVDGLMRARDDAFAAALAETF